jgi:hypothetical protein
MLCYGSCYFLAYSCSCLHLLSVLICSGSVLVCSGSVLGSHLILFLIRFLVLVLSLFPCLILSCLCLGSVLVLSLVLWFLFSVLFCFVSVLFCFGSVFDSVLVSGWFLCYSCVYSSGYSQVIPRLVLCCSVLFCVGSCVGSVLSLCGYL